MGCAGTKPKKDASSAREESFQPVEQKKAFSSKNDVVAKRKDFIVEYKDIKVYQETYTMKEVIGSGAYGKVQLAQRNDNGEMRAVKIIDKLELDPAEQVRLQYEIEILKNLNHPNIVRLYEVYESRSNIHIVTELCDGQELFAEIVSQDNFTENEAAKVTKQVLQAIAYCHGQQIAHRDLKPENILIDVKNGGSIKVIDFGTSQTYDANDHTMHQMYGTPYYIAPEVLFGKYTEKCDLWSIGVILYVMLSGQPPFTGKEDSDITAKVKKANWSFNGPIWKQISDEAKDLIEKLMDKNPDTRITAIDALQHPWLKMKVSQKVNLKQTSKAIAGLSSFQNESKMKQAALTFMSSHMATKKQQRELKISFDQFDENGDGMIQRDEFLKAYRSQYPDKDVASVDERANAIFDKADTDGSGAIDFGEWCTATIDQDALLNEPNLRAAFRLFDKDNGGTIDAGEIAALFGHNVSDEEQVWQDVVAEVDVNGDGQIDFEEFKIMMRKFADIKTDAGMAGIDNAPAKKA